MSHDERIVGTRARLEPVRAILREYGADLIVDSEVDAGVILNRKGKRIGLRVGFSPYIESIQLLDAKYGGRRWSGSEGMFRRWLEETLGWRKAGQKEEP